MLYLMAEEPHLSSRFAFVIMTMKAQRLLGRYSEARMTVYLSMNEQTIILSLPSN